MATDILVNGVGEVLKKVCSIAADEIGVAWGVKGELQRLQRKLSMIRSWINDAEKQQEEKELVKQWLQTLKGIAYDAEDVLDDFKVELFRRKMEMQTRKSKVRNFFSLTNPIAFRFKTAHKIKVVNDSLVKIKDDSNTFEFKKENNSQQHNTVGEKREVITTSRVNTSAIIGRDDEKGSVVRLLKSSDKDHVVISVLPIVGVGGLGKTTLAQLVYGDDEVKKSFDIRIWICVSNVFDVQRIMKEIIESITKSEYRLSNLDKMVSEIQDKMRGKKFLLVLDDVWNEERITVKWKTFKDLLGGAGVRGSKVIVTTRSEEVSSLVGTLGTHRLNKLLEDTSWRLFEQNAFSDGRAPENSNLTEIGKDIARKCGGVPLGLVHLGGVMRTKEHERDWLHIRDNELWRLQPESHMLMRILKWSYNCLSPPLQHCFSYCAIFPKDAVIDKKVLVQLWMAEGFLQQPKSGSLSTEDIGDGHWKMLRHHSFFQDVKEDGFHCTFKMHDLVHDLACSLAGKEWCFGNLDRNEDAAEIRFMLAGSNLLESLSNIYKLRTFRMAERRPCVSIEAMFLKLKYVRVLDLQASDVKELPSSVSKLRHLKFFDLSRNPIVQLPDSICSLYNLQTLRLVDCRKLEALPVETRKLIGLRHLEIQGCSQLGDMPRDIRRLSSLQTLSKFIVGKEGSGCSIRELQHLNLGGELVIKGLQNVATEAEAKAANLAEKSNVHTLKLFWASAQLANTDNTDVLEGLRPHSNLRKLVVDCVVGVNIPTWMNIQFLRELVEMEITGWKRCENLPQFGQLPSLKVLRIRGMDCLRCIGNEFYGCDDNRDRSQEAGLAFPSLRVLEIQGMSNLEEWVEPAVDSSFPLLETLVIRRCPKLTKTPNRLLFPSLKKLVEMEINGWKRCENLPPLGQLPSLRVLMVDGMDCLRCIGNEFYGCDDNRDRSQEVGVAFPSLLVLKIEDMSSLEEWVEPAVDSSFPLLEELQIRGCPKLTKTPSRLLFPSLKKLTVRGISSSSVESLSSKVSSFTDLDLWSINDMMSLPQGLLGRNGLLRSIDISYCPELVALPSDELGHLKCLETLWIRDCQGLTSVPDLRCVTSLRFLRIINCQGVIYPEGLHSLSLLERLEIGPFREELDVFSLEGIQHMVSLRWLYLVGWLNIKSLPELEVRHLTKLQRLEIHRFENLEALPDWLTNLSSLESLWISYCPNLKHLPQGKMSQLKRFGVWDCPLLKERCERDRGEEWEKISHIPDVIFAGG